MHTRNSSSVLCAMLLAFALPLPAAAASPDVPDHPWRAARGPHLSAAGEQMLRDRLVQGLPVPAGAVRRWRLDLPLPGEERPPESPSEETPGASGMRPDATGVALSAMAADVLVNDRSGDASCAACGFRPLAQSETSIVSLGTNLLAGWNDSKGFCAGAVQGYGYSVDTGATWTDAGEVPALAGGGRWRGDPVLAVNRKLGDFYICGLYEGGTNGAGLAVLRGHFASGTFVVDLDQQIAVGGADFLDKDWIACDSLTGNLYVTYSNFIGGVNSQIELIRSVDRGLTWSAPQVLSSPAAYGNVQSSRPSVGPHGELYVVWDEYANPQNHLRIRRSDDFGATFGPERTVADFYENDWSGAPGYRRGFGMTLPGIAIDETAGPHGGRVYVSWDEAVNFEDAPVSTATVVNEAEPDDFYAGAVPFTVGQALRGANPSTSDVDTWRFSGLRGQTIFCAVDSSVAATTIDLRLVCSQDTTSFSTIRSLAYCRATNPAFGFTLPADGDYYVRVSTGSSSGLGGYRLVTAWDTPSAGERARDHRDQFVAWSDDGAAWSTPVRVNDSDPWYDGIFPEITVDGTGAAHAYWHDFREDPVCGALSREYMVSTGDGGVTWGANRALSDVSTFWSTNVCGSANQGDYQGITSEGATVYPCWADPRLGDPDVYMERAVLGGAVACAADASAPAGTDVVMNFSLTNDGDTEGSFGWALSDVNGWLVSTSPPGPGTVSLAAGGTLTVTAHFRSADCQPAPLDSIRFRTADLLVPGRADTCTTLLTCTGAVAVGGGAPLRLALEGARPNPARGDWVVVFALPPGAPAALELIDAAGRRVVRQDLSTLGAGRHVLQLSRAGRIARGVYLLRLTQGGETIERKVSVLE